MIARNVVVLVAFALSSLSLRASAEDPSLPKTVTYNRDVAPILYKNCVVCHRPNDIAPMSLLTYKETHPWARSIREAVVQRKMPPWHADPKVGEFLNDPRVTEADIATIDAWFRTGAKEGEAKDLPRLPCSPKAGTLSPTSCSRFPGLR